MDGHSFLDQNAAFRIDCIHKIFREVVNSSASFEQFIKRIGKNAFHKKWTKMTFHSRFCGGVRVASLYLFF